MSVGWCVSPSPPAISAPALRLLLLGCLPILILILAGIPNLFFQKQVFDLPPFVSLCDLHVINSSGGSWAVMHIKLQFLLVAVDLDNLIGDKVPRKREHIDTPISQTSLSG